MTEIHLHGILGKKYGRLHRLAIKEPKDVVRALEANHEGFLKDLKDLLGKKIIYTIIADDHWVQGNSFVENKKIKKIDFVPAIIGSGPLAIISLVISVGFAVYSYVQSSKQQYPQIPGAEGTSMASSKSLSFSNRENITEQGNPVPLVYGRLKVGSFVIQSTVKSFPLTLTLTDEFLNSTAKKSGNQLALIDSPESTLSNPKYA
jgi:predicted phage tail protein